MLNETELARLIVSWKNQFGEEIKGRMCVPIDNALRTEMYKNLIKTLVELHSYTLEDFEGNTYRRVMEASINPNSEKKEVWRKIATDDWHNAIDVFFPQKVLRHDSSNDPKPIRIEKPELVMDDAPVELKKPLDRSVFGAMPKVEHVIDEDFLNMLKEVGDE